MLLTTLLLGCQAPLSKKANATDNKAQEITKPASNSVVDEQKDDVSK